MNAELLTRTAEGAQQPITTGFLLVRFGSDLFSYSFL